MAQMTDEELGALADAEIRAAVGLGTGALASERMKAESYFYAEAKGDLAPPEVIGRSSVVVPVVRNTIEAMLPQLMVKFTGGDTVVEFEPTQRDDEQKAKNCTDYLNYLFFKKNSGHSVTYSWFKDALKFKRGIVKVWWDTRTEETREEYRGLDQVELAQIMDDEEVEVIEQKSYPDEEDGEQRQEAISHLTQQLQQAQAGAQQGQAPALQAVMAVQAQIDRINQTPQAMLYDIACKRKKTGGKLCIENVPPEEFGISRKAKMDMQEAPAVVHRFRRTKSEMLSMGYSAKVIESIGGDNSDEFANGERAQRARDGDYFNDSDTETGDESQRQYVVSEVYMRVDYDGDGIAELRKICRSGGVNLDNEIVDVIPFVSICPIPEPHKFFGLSVADLAMAGQKIETVLLRSSLDNQSLEVNGRYFAVEGQVNLDDLLSSRPGGIVRVKTRDAVGRLDQGKGNIGETMSMMEYMKAFNEDSTGWSRLSQGNDPSSLNRPETATKANIVSNKADMRLDLIARNFAEGFIDLFKMMLRLVGQYQKKSVSIKLSGAWVDMDPREWRNQFDVTINVGLGVGNKDQQVQHLTVLQQVQANGLAIGISKPENLYQSSLELAKAMGFKNYEKFFTEPDPNAPMPNPAAAEAQAKLQAEQMKTQASTQLAQEQAKIDMQLEQAKLQQQGQIEQMKMQMQAEVDRNRQAAEAQQHALKVQQDAQLEQVKAQFEQQKHMNDMDFQRWKAQLDASVKIEVANIMSKAKLQDAATDAATAEASQGMQS